MTTPKKAKPRVKRRVVAEPGADERTPEQVKHARMLDLIAATKAQAEREAELDWRLSRALGGAYDGPMLGELLGGDDDRPVDRVGSPTLEQGPIDRGGSLGVAYELTEKAKR